MSENLLPVGFYDLLFDEAKQNHQNINKALDLFFSFGYQLIKPPLVQFSASLEGGKFLTTDVISGKTLEFRNDITPQIARLLATRLQDEKLPLKLCYAGDVLCTKSENLYADRQQTQVGIEIIGCDEKKSDYEVVEILLSALAQMNVGKAKKDFFIEFTLSGFLPIFIEELGKKISVNNRQELAEAIVRKELSAIRKLTGKYYEIIKKAVLSNSNAVSTAKEISTALKSEKITDELEDQIAEISYISRFLQKNFPQVRLGFDLFGSQENSYHRGPSFDIFHKDFSYPIARGGRYKAVVRGKEISAVGGTIYMNNLRKISS
jgi:ATP phosphoribosyltransferase regulatory subunit